MTTLPRDLTRVLTRVLTVALAAALWTSSWSPPAAEAAKVSPPGAWSREDLAAAVRLRTAVQRDSGSFAVVRDLTTQVGPRSAGSAGDAAAVKWAVARLRALGYDRVYTQEVTVPHWDRGDLEARIELPYPQRLVAVSLGGSVGTVHEGLSAEVVRVDSLEALKALPNEALAGRIVFVDQKMERARDGKGYGATVRGRVDGASVAGAKGAAAVVIRSVGTDASARFAHTGSVVYAVNAPRIPAVAISNPDADVLARQLAELGSNGKVRIFLRSTARDLPQAKSANVIGEITGSGKPDEVVLLGAHLDSWDLGHGAIDDGAGVAIVAAAGAALKREGLRPKRTVRVVLFANEEFGLSGANEYARREAPNAARHVGAVEADFGGGRVYEFNTRVLPEALPAMKQLQAILAPLGIEAGNNEASGGADIGPLRREGVPMFGLAQDGTLYFDNHHTLNDTLDKVDPAAMDQATAAYAVLAWLLAQSNVALGPVPLPALPATK